MQRFLFNTQGLRLNGNKLPLNGNRLYFFKGQVVGATVAATYVF